MNPKKLFQMAKATMDKKGNLMEELLPLAEPMLMQFVEKFNKPEAEGGFLSEGDSCIGITIMPYKLKEPDTIRFAYLLVSYAYDKERNVMMITKKLPLSQLSGTEKTQ